MRLYKIKWFESSEEISGGNYPFMDVDGHLWLSEFEFLYTSQTNILVGKPTTNKEKTLYKKHLLNKKIEEYC